MLNIKTLPSKCYTLSRTALSNSSKIKEIVSCRFYQKQSTWSRDKPLFLKYFTQICGTGILCGTAAYYLKNSQHLFPRHLIVNAVDMNDDDRPNLFYFLADMIEKAQPSVVFIEVTISLPNGIVVEKSHGSGFIVREDGLILTNAHVIKRPTSVKVKLHDGRVVNGQVQAVDSITDLATIKINEKNLPVIKLGKSSVSRPGEFVVAMGSPLTFSNTATFGIISSVNRGSKELGMHNRDMEYIQTDAAITKGNSGGPLMNVKGEAIGINTLNITNGISFAIPSDRAAEFLRRANELEKRSSSKGIFSRGKQRRYLGITMFTLSPDYVPSLQTIPNFPKNITGGVLILRVEEGSPAHRAGLQQTDVIVKINGKDATSAVDVYREIESSDTLTLEIVRKNQNLKIMVKQDLID